MTATPPPDRGLPEFAHPPVVEVAAAIQFTPIGRLDAAMLGALWLRFRDQYPKTSQQLPLPRVSETFGAPKLQRFGFSVEPALPVPRLWFLNDDNTRLVQVQSDRLIVNWRQLNTDAPYPRYGTLRQTLIETFETIETFLREEALGTIVTDQAELTYVNHFSAGPAGKPRIPLSHYLRFWQEPDTTFLRRDPEEASFRTQYVIGDDGPLGRLFVELESAYNTTDRAPIYVMNLVARGAPPEHTLDSATAFLDQAHRWIVQTFADVTTHNVHVQWERTQ